VATKEQIFEWIYEPCALPFTDAMQIAEVVATKLVEENGSSHNKQIPQCSYCGTKSAIMFQVCYQCRGSMPG